MINPIDKYPELTEQEIDALIHFMSWLMTLPFNMIQSLSSIVDHGSYIEEVIQEELRHRDYPDCDHDAKPPICVGHVISLHDYHCPEDGCMFRTFSYRGLIKHFKHYRTWVGTSRAEVQSMSLT